MNTYPKLQEPFAFWLVQQFLPIENDNEEAVPISNREFYSIMGMIIVVLVVLEMIFHGLPF
jgi:hypothetical protein